MKHIITGYPQSSGPLAVRIVYWARDTRDGGRSTLRLMRTNRSEAGVDYLAYSKSTAMLGAKKIHTHLFSHCNKDI